MKKPLLFAGLAGCAVGIRFGDVAAADTLRTNVTSTQPKTPHQALRCGGSSPVMQTASMTGKLYDRVSWSVMGLMAKLDASCSDGKGKCPQGAFAGCVVRLAGHDFMDFQDGQGGSDGCINLDEADNAGLAPCLYEGIHGVSLQSAYANFCNQVSLADFIVIAAEAVMTHTRNMYVTATPGTRRMDFRSKFKFGRTTAATCEFSLHRLPSAHGGCGPVEKTFVNNLGLSWPEAAALMGAHSLGRAHPENSGFDGWWTAPAGARHFNNDYFGHLITKGWWMSHDTKETQWDRVDKGAVGAGRQMMLSTDLCLAFGEADAKSVVCCPWQTYEPFKDAIASGGGDFCGNPGTSAAKRTRDQLKKDCCGPFADHKDCDDPEKPKGKAIDAVKTFATNEGAWVDAFHVAWTKATERGAVGLKRLSP